MNEKSNSGVLKDLFIRPPVTTPVTWNEIQDILEKNEIHRLSRTPEVLETYLQRLSVIKTDFESVEDFIFHRFWNLEVEINPKSGKNKLKAGTDINNLQPTILFTENEFPYCVETGVGHYMLWHLRPMEASELQQVLTKYLPDCVYLYYKNPMEIRSVKKIDHWQIFAKKK